MNPSPPLPRRKKNLKGFFAVIALIGLGLIAQGFRTGFHPYAILHRWPKADALILSSQLASRFDLHHRIYNHETIYWPVVKVQYSVAGKDYVELATYEAKSDLQSDWQPVIDDLKPGSHHLLPYDPSDPSRMVIGTRWNLANLGFAGAFVLSGVVLALIALLGLVSKPRTAGAVARPRES